MVYFAKTLFLNKIVLTYVLLSTAALLCQAQSNSTVNSSSTCLFTGAPQKKPLPSLRFCFRSNINSCCLTAHDQLIGDIYAGFMPSECLNKFPELEFFACFGCHFKQPQSTVIQGWQSDADSAKLNKEVHLCEGFVQRLWGQKDLDSPTTKFDECGLYDSDGNVVIPSKTEGYKKALDFLKTIGIPLFENYEIFIDPDPSGTNCFNAAVNMMMGGVVGLAAAFLSLF